MNNLRITPCGKPAEWKPGEIVEVTSRSNPKKPDNYLVLRASQNSKDGVFALPVSSIKEVELHPRTLASSNNTKSVQATGLLLNCVA